MKGGGGDSAGDKRKIPEYRPPTSYKDDENLEKPSAPRVGLTSIKMAPDINDPGPAQYKKLKQVVQTQPDKPDNLITVTVAQPKMSQPPQQPPMFAPPGIGYPITNQSFYPQMGNYPQALGYYSQPIINKTYITRPEATTFETIRTDNPTLGDLPPSLATVDERLAYLRFLRSVILRNRDGEFVPFRGYKFAPKSNTPFTSTRSIYDMLKIIDVNPYRNMEEKDKYITLPTNTLLTRACYPIRRASSLTRNVVCAKDSIAINIRVYRLRMKELPSEMAAFGAKLFDSDIWREMHFYQYVTENIVKRKVSPNFVSIIGYSMCNNSEIDFDAIEARKLGKRPTPPQKMIQDPATLKMKPNPDAYKRDIVVTITESPTYSLIRWASCEYEQIGYDVTMVNSGYHTVDAWHSVIFQLLSVMYIIQREKIYIRELSLENNIYIKELPECGAPKNHWIYIINGIQYYVPNYGYIVMLDSKFSDSVNPSTDPDQKYKYFGTLYEDIQHKSPNDDALNQKIFEQFLNMIDPNNFGQSFAQQNGVDPGLRELFTKMKKSAMDFYAFCKARNSGHPNLPHIDYTHIIELVIRTYFNVYLHNRIGTQTTADEKAKLLSIASPPYGSLIVQVNGSASTICLCVGEYNPSSEQPDDVIFHRALGGAKLYKIIGTNGQLQTIPANGLFIFPPNYVVRQEFLSNAVKLDETTLLEIYSLGNNARDEHIPLKIEKDPDVTVYQSGAVCLSKKNMDIIHNWKDNLSTKLKPNMVAISTSVQNLHSTVALPINITDTLRTHLVTLNLSALVTALKVPATDASRATSMLQQIIDDLVRDCATIKSGLDRYNTAHAQATAIVLNECTNNDAIVTSIQKELDDIYKYIRTSPI